MFENIKKYFEDWDKLIFLHCTHKWTNNIIELYYILYLFYKWRYFPFSILYILVEIGELFIFWLCFEVLFIINCSIPNFLTEMAEGNGELLDDINQKADDRGDGERTEDYPKLLEYGLDKKVSIKKESS